MQNGTERPLGEATHFSFCIFHFSFCNDGLRLCRSRKARPDMQRILLLLVMAWWVGPSAARADNWIYWRGPHQNGYSDDTDLPAKWSADPKAPNSNLVWTQPYGGRSTP